MEKSLRLGFPATNNEAEYEKHKLLNVQKSIFGNKMTKVALSLRTWVVACLRELNHAYASTFLRTQLRF